VHDFLVGSALVQLSFGVWLGWVVLGFAGGRSSIGPFRKPRPTLQCHLDNLMMGGLQLAIAAAVDELPAVPTLLIVFGSWINPQLFLAMAVGFSAGGPAAYRAPAAVSARTATSTNLDAAEPRSPLRQLTRTVRFASFGSLTVGYPWLAVSTIA
jgi:hydroxylaminobenzene mutase